MNRLKIGIVGLGFVGNAVRESYRNDPFIEVIEIDLDPSKGCSGTYTDIVDADAVFVCVPSPMNDDGSCNTQPLEAVLDNLLDYQGVIISKVTAPPSVYEKLQSKFKNLVHAPEFLTAANAVEDYLSSQYLIIGGDNKAYMHEANRVIKIGLPAVETTFFCTIKEASLTKYTINSFLATKVVFMNEMAALAQASGVNWNKVRELIALDDRRIGNSHTQVPGFDGKFGFGGACFPKDTSALLKYAESMDVDMNVLDAAVKKNLLLRLTDSK